jgi:hypothetical protein
VIPGATSTPFNSARNENGVLTALPPVDGTLMASMVRRQGFEPRRAQNVLRQFGGTID